MIAFQKSKGEPDIKATKELLDRLEVARCPGCGGEVFFPMAGWQVDYGGTQDDPIVFCKDMGHWVGHLSETRIFILGVRNLFLDD